MDAETQTDSMDVSDPDLSPRTSSPPSSTQQLGMATNSSITSYPQRVILQEFKDSIDKESRNGNCVQLYYMEPPDQGKFKFLFIKMCRKI